jgi:predicted ferric reductase
VEENSFTRITIPAKFTWKPGQHCFLRFTSFGFLQSLSAHPFTICSSPSPQPNGESELVFYIRHQSGFTAKLYQHAIEHPSISAPVLVDGPYGGINLQKYHESDHLVIIAGGSGAGWCLPFIDRFIRYGIMAADEERGTAISSDAKETLPLDS